MKEEYKEYYKENYKQLNIHLKVSDYERLIKILEKKKLTKVQYLLEKMKEDENNG